MHKVLSETKGICIVFSVILLTTSGCSSARYKNSFSFKGVDFGPNLSSNCKQGIKDGCMTADGHFVKNYKLSSLSPDYHKGWEIGRSRCRQMRKKDTRAQIYTVYEQSVRQKRNERNKARKRRYSDIESIDI